MEPTTCSSCGTWVAPKADGTCPACGSPIGKDGQTTSPAHSPEAARASFLREAGSERMHGRPTGLTVLAVFQIIAAAGSCLGLLRLVSSPQLRAEVEAVAGTVGMWQVLFSFTGMLLVLITAFGYISQSRVWGYWLGNLAAVGSVAIAIVSIASRGQPLLHIPGLFYWTVVFLLLNFYYRNAFR